MHKISIIYVQYGDDSVWTGDSVGLNLYCVGGNIKVLYK